MKKELALKYTDETFREKLKSIYGDTYDFEDVNYDGIKAIVVLKCKKHGLFSRRTSDLLVNRACPECMQEHKKEDYALRAEHRKKTMMSKYGVDNPMKLDSVKDKIKQTCLNRYGVDNPRKLESVVDKARRTNTERYGDISYAKTDKGIARIQDTMEKRYGAKNFMQSDAHLDVVESMVEKSRQTQLKRYGVKHYSQSDEAKKLMSVRKLKEFESKRKNGTFNASNGEMFVELKLIERFGKNDVVKQYRSNEYPYACDFYVKSRDMYIELNYHWTHNTHWFDIKDEDDYSTFEEWFGKASESKFYDNAVHVWTVRDVQKRECAAKNRLNYVVFWDNNLRDFELWLAMGCPDGHDYERMYSWLPDRYISKISCPDEITGTPKNLSLIAKACQFPVFYEQEIKMWNENKFYKGLPLQIYLYYNRFKYLGKLPEQLSDLAIMNSFTISGIRKGYTVFNTELMNKVTDKYDIKSVYDPCAGWGERLLCCYYNDIDYFGVDVNTKLKQGYIDMVNKFNITKQTVIYADASKYSPMGVFDAVITCPPYGSTEIYSDAGAENLSNFEFLDWWNNVVKNCCSVNPTYFCFQINQKWIDKMVDVVKRQGFEVIEKFDYSSNLSSHFTRKNGVNTKKEHETMVVMKRKTLCYDVYYDF